jgi:hypothetical protein
MQPVVEAKLRTAANLCRFNIDLSHETTSRQRGCTLGKISQKFLCTTLQARKVRFVIGYITETSMLSFGGAGLNFFLFILSMVDLAIPVPKCDEYVL